MTLLFSELSTAAVVEFVLLLIEMFLHFTIKIPTKQLVNEKSIPSHPSINDQPNPITSPTVTFPANTDKLNNEHNTATSEKIGEYKGFADAVFMMEEKGNSSTLSMNGTIASPAAMIDAITANMMNVWHV